MNDDLSTGYLDESRRPFNTKTVTTGILFSFLCILSCLIFLRIQWLLPGAYYASGIQYQLLGGIPVLAWTVFLLFNRIPVLNRNQFWKLFALAVILRIILVDVPPVQSSDIYRYIWEGRLHWEGINPYRYPPDNPGLFYLNDNLHERINHGHLPAIYPPLTQWWNALAVYPGYCLTGRPIPWMKMAYIFWDLMTLLLLPTWLKRNRMNSSWSVVWAFHPLVIIEFSGNGHLDSLMIFLMLAAMCLTARPNNGKISRKCKICNAPAVAILLAGAVSAKIIPILAFPFFVWQLKRRAAWLLLVPILFLFSYLPYQSAGFSGLILSAREYLTVWAGPAPAFSLITICSGGNDQIARLVYQTLVAILVAVATLVAIVVAIPVAIRGRRMLAQKNLDIDFIPESCLYVL